MKVKSLLFSSLLLAGGIVISSCLDGSSSSTTTDTILTGTFVDAPVDGLEYTTSSGLSGVTSNGGKFSFRDGDTVTFKVGNVTLGDVQLNSQKTIINPLDLFQNATGVNDPKVLITIRLLQSLDSDGNPTNGITIDSNTASNLPQINIETDVDSTNYTSVETDITNAGVTLITENNAINNFTSNNYISAIDDRRLIISGTDFFIEGFDINNNYVNIQGTVNDVTDANNNPLGFISLDSTTTNFLAVSVPSVGNFLLYNKNVDTANGNAVYYTGFLPFLALGTCPNNTTAQNYNIIYVIPSTSYISVPEVGGYTSVVFDSNTNQILADVFYTSYDGTQWTSIPTTANYQYTVSCDNGKINGADTNNTYSLNGIVTPSGMFFAGNYTSTTNDYEGATVGSLAPSTNITTVDANGNLTGSSLASLNFIGFVNNLDTTGEYFYIGKVSFDSTGLSAGFYPVIDDGTSLSFATNAAVTITIDGELSPGLLTGSVTDAQGNTIPILFAVGTVTDAAGNIKYVLYGREANSSTATTMATFLFIQQ